MTKYFETRVKYDKMLENGVVKSTTETYIVDALTFTEAETRTTERLSPLISGDFTVSVAKKTKIEEILFNEDAERYYLAKYAIIVMDDNGGEKRQPVQILIQASDFDEGYQMFLGHMNGTIADWEMLSLSETPIIDVFAK